jgi:hypothetical protein
MDRTASVYTAVLDPNFIGPIIQGIIYVVGRGEQFWEQINISDDGEDATRTGSSETTHEYLICHPVQAELILYLHANHEEILRTLWVLLRQRRLLEHGKGMRTEEEERARDETLLNIRRALEPRMRDRVESGLEKVWLSAKGLVGRLWGLLRS